MNLRNKIYYQMKLWIPRRIRLTLRRAVARRIRGATRGTWPICPGSETPPAGWPGWPADKQFAFVITHDVEGPKGFARCRQLMRLEEERGFRSSFNFVPEGDYRVTKELREEMVARGFEVGVHDLRHDGKLFQSRRAFSDAAIKINRYLEEWHACGFRAGFMLHDLEWLRDLRTLYDASTFDTDPFEPQPDGVETIFPFILPSTSQNQGYVELPYTLPQDSTVFVLFKEKTNRVWRAKLDWIAARGGMALVNIHPDYTSFRVNPGFDEFPVSLYADFLLYVGEKYSGQYFHCLPRQLAEHVRDSVSARFVSTETFSASPSLIKEISKAPALKTSCNDATSVERSTHFPV